MGLPTPNTRKEQYLNAIATGNAGGLPTPITREEEYLDAIAKSGGGSGDGDMKKSVYDSDSAVSNAGGIKAFVNDAISGKVDKEAGKGLSANDYNDTEKGKVTANAEAIEAMVNVTGSCNILPNNASGQTAQLSVDFTFNSDGSCLISGTPTGRFGYHEICHSYLLKKGTYKISSGLPSSSNIFLSISKTSDGLEIVTSTSSEDGIVEFTIADDTYINAAIGFYVPSNLPSVSGTIYPMLYDARLTPTGYVPYAMTNRELTERFAVVTGTTESDTNITSIPYPQGFTRDNTFIVTLAIYISSRWYQYNNTNTFYAVTINGGIEVVAEDSTVRGKPIKLLLMRA